MPTLQEYRKKYPQYDDMTDEKLIERVNRKYANDPSRWIVEEKPFDWKNFLETVFPPVQLANVAYDILTDNHASLAERTENIKKRKQRDNAFLRGAGDLFGANWLSARLSPLFGVGPSANAGSLEEAKALEEAASRTARDHHSNAYNLGQLSGGIAATLPLPFVGSPLLSLRALGSAAVAAPVAAVQGALAADAVGEDSWKAAKEDAVVAGLVGGAVPVLSSAAKTAWRGVNAFKQALLPNISQTATRVLGEGLSGKSGKEALTPEAIQPLIDALDRQAGRDAAINAAAGYGAPRFQQTTGLAIGAPPAVAAEKAARLAEPEPFVAKASENTQALNHALESLAPGIDPNLARQAFGNLLDGDLAKANAELVAAQGGERTAALDAARRVEEAQRQAASFKAQGERAVISAKTMSGEISSDVLEELAADNAARLGRIDSPKVAPPSRDYQDIGRQAHDVIRKTHDTVQSQARALYDAIPQETLIPGSRVLGAVAEDMLQRFEPNSSLLTKIAGGVQDDLTASDLLSLTRSANKIYRAAKASGNLPLAAQAQKISAEASDFLTSPKTPPEVASAFTAAQDFFAKNVAPFRQGELGGVTRMGRFGEASATEPSITLKSFIRPDAQAGAERAAELLHVIERGGASVKDDVKDYVGGLIAEKAVKDGRIDAAAIRALLQSHAAFFKRFPEIASGVQRLANRAQSADGKLAQALAKAEDSRNFASKAAQDERNRTIALAQEKAAKMDRFAQNQVSKVKTEGAQHLRAMQEAVERATSAQKAAEAASKTSPAGIFAASDPQTAINRMFAHRDPSAFARDLMASAKASGGDAPASVKQALSDWLANRLHQTGRVATEGGMADLKLSAAQLERLIGRNGKHRRVLAEFYSPQELKLLDTIREEVSRPALLANQATSGSATAERLSGTERLGGFVQQHSQRLVHILSVAAGFGGYSSGGAVPAILGLAGVELFGYLRQQGRKRVADLVNRALVDPKLARTLLLSANDPRNISRLRQAFEALEANASRLGVVSAAMGN